MEINYSTNSVSLSFVHGEFYSHSPGGDSLEVLRLSQQH